MVRVRQFACAKRSWRTVVQYQLPLIRREYAGSVIQQRAKDGYINATAMCNAALRVFSTYNRSDTTQAFLKVLSVDVQIHTSELVQIVKGGEQSLQGTWVHPRVAIHLAQWLSPDFAVLVSKWVFDWMSGKQMPSAQRLPYHLRRYVANQQNVPHGHFSILTEITQLLIAPMEAMGYELPEALWPDISEGKIFCAWLREEAGIHTDALPTYLHVFEDGRRPVRAKAYPNQYLAAFRQHFAEVWIPERSPDYFGKRDPAALTYLPKLLPKPARG
ncbi:KilA-N domain-containing protein [Azospirillum sp. RWY-5-1]|uniref:KilA-N domain-containing protein n=1 Tax=Azospirillum oleiclasticum TaxID=2735135 RepID=A0ABX2TJC6_9PROT|nr:KilA-N domain-containing protein [Azospirillum oleiclasticum]NYZ16645.1 KilA-N domain-containing protein [Azospirillum oleiclasticum]NYZ24132.1 KilA-N domain-containing protein [Azospirillum oleiclasticum]